MLSRRLPSTLKTQRSSGIASTVGAGERRLAEDVAGAGEDARVERADRAGVGLDDLVAGVEPRPRLGREDQVERARLRRADDERLVSVHCPPPRIRTGRLLDPAAALLRPVDGRQPGRAHRAPVVAGGGERRARRRRRRSGRCARSRPSRRAWRGRRRRASARWRRSGSPRRGSDRPAARRRGRRPAVPCGRKASSRQVQSAVSSIAMPASEPQRTTTRQPRSSDFSSIGGRFASSGVALSW